MKRPQSISAITRPGWPSVAMSVELGLNIPPPEWQALFIWRDGWLTMKKPVKPGFSALKPLLTALLLALLSKRLPSARDPLKIMVEGSSSGERPHFLRAI